MGLKELKRFFYEAWGVQDCAGPAMVRAIELWERLTFGDSILSLPGTILGKLLRAVFAEYQLRTDPQFRDLCSLPLRDALRVAMQTGEAFLWPDSEDNWSLLGRADLLVFRRDGLGNPTDVGFLARQWWEGRDHMKLLQRRTRDGEGRLCVANRIFRSRSQGDLGREVPVSQYLPQVPGEFVYDGIPGVGMVRMALPLPNCVDGSREAVSIFAPAARLIQLAEENERQLCREFENGRSRLVVSRDLLRDGQLQDDLFVGLDEDPQVLGITVFSPELRQESFLQRQQSYLRAIENAVGLKRGLLSQVDTVQRTATEITSSEGEYLATILMLRSLCQEAAEDWVALRCSLEGCQVPEFAISWGDNVI